MSFIMDDFENIVLKELEKYNIVEVADESDVSNATLYNWLNRKTRSPRISTLEKVLPVIGLTMKVKVTRG